MIMDNQGLVAIVHYHEVVGYPPPPYSPQCEFPEYPWRRRGPLDKTNANKNDVYSLVRESLRLLEMDGSKFGTDSWNPLGDLIKPGDTVLIKPNFVHHHNSSGGGTDCLVTQGAVIRPLIDYAALAMNGTGKLILGDAPLQLCDFKKLLKVSGVESLMGFYAEMGITIQPKDFRAVVSHKDGLGIFVQGDNETPGPEEYVLVNLKESSALCSLDGNSSGYRVTCYSPSAMAIRHKPGRHEYLIAKSVLSADVVINIAKMKTHKKAGVTGALKNTVGINTNKEFLPHHRVGAPGEGGDEYRQKSYWKRACSRFLDRGNESDSRLSRYWYHFASMACWGMVKLFNKDMTWEGSWPGNDTLWRMVLDLNKILLYADKEGNIQPIPQRKLLCVVDGIIAGEGQGPLSPTPRPAGVILCGSSAPMVDALMATVMGFDWRIVPCIREAMKGLGIESSGITVVSNKKDLCGALDQRHRLFSFTPPRFWESLRIARHQE